jgi:hypothetical protein
MAGATWARERLMADHQFGSGQHGIYAPQTWFLGLSKTAPNDDGSNFTEPVAMGYTRVTAASNAPNFPAAFTTAGVTYKSTGGTFTFPNPTGEWGTLTHWGFFTGLTGGLPQYYGQLDNPLVVKTGNNNVGLVAGGLVMEWD